MSVKPSDLPDIFEERRTAEHIVDLDGALRVSYRDWQNDLRVLYAIYRNEFSVVWPDGEVTRALPMVPNFIQLAADDRARSVAAMNPTVTVSPAKVGDEARAKADKAERIFSDWLWRSRVPGRTTQSWALDAMMSGLVVCRVWADWDKPREERYPRFDRLPPARCMPEPVFGQGPNIDSMVVSYDERITAIENRWHVDLSSIRSSPVANPSRATVIEYYDQDIYTAIVRPMTRYDGAPTPSPQVLVQTEHRLGCCPVVIGTRPAADGPYRGEFNGGVGLLNYWNRLMTLILDDATARVYDSPLVWNVENDTEFGPGVVYRAEAPDARFEFPRRGNEAFSNLSLLKDLGAMSRAMTILPPSRSGDPNESIISAAGISATQSQYVEDVRSIQWHILAPMFDAALEVGVELEKAWGVRLDGKRITKSIGAAPGSMAESYTPSDLEDIGRISLRYGIGAGLDPINTNVMVLQQRGNGLLDRRTAMEQSPFIEDAQRTERRLLLESLDDALMQGLLQAAATGQMDAQTLAAIRRAAEQETSLHDIVATYSILSPVAAPAGSPSAGPEATPPESPGMAGAAEPVEPARQEMPSLAQLLQIAPQTRSARRGGV